MPLYAGKVKFKDQELVHAIPVWAPNEDEALRYLESSNEWLDDGGICALLKDEGGIAKERNDETRLAMARRLCSVLGVVAVLDPLKSPFDGGTVCWHTNCQEDEITAAAAFYDAQLLPVMADLREREDKFESDNHEPSLDAYAAGMAFRQEWSAYFQLEERLVEQFDAIRFNGVSLDQAMIMGHGSADGSEIDPAQMQAIARVLLKKVEDLNYELVMAELGHPEIKEKDDEPPLTLN